MGRLFESVWLLRVVALAMALAIWAEAVPTFIPIVPRVVAGVPVRVVGTPPGWQALAEASTVQVEVRCPASMRRLTPFNVLATVSAAGLGPGRHRVAVSVTLPWGAQLVGVSPSWVVVRVARRPAAGARVAAGGTP